MDYLKARRLLRDRRLELGLGVEELAKKAGFHKTTVYRLEDLNDEPERSPDLRTLERLAVVLQLGSADFFAQVQGLPAPDDGNIKSGGSSTSPQVARDGDSISPSAAAAALSEANLYTLAERFVSIIERIVEARQQVAIAGNPSPAGNESDRAIRRSHPG